MNIQYLTTTTAAWALAASLISGPAAAGIINFDDISNPGCCTYLQSPYQGLTWSGGQNAASWVITDIANSSFTGIQAHSGANYAWSNGGTNLYVGGALFDFNNMWARAGNGPGFTAIAHGYFGSNELFTQSFAVTDVYQSLTFNFLGIDSLTITDQTNNLLMDDINLTMSVPEPVSILLLALGLALMGLSQRRNVSAAAYT